jgi:hypothetical protein
MPSTDTLRDLILDGYEISIHCRAYPCGNRAKADLAAVARKHGLDWQWFGRAVPRVACRFRKSASPSPHFDAFQIYGRARVRRVQQNAMTPCRRAASIERPKRLEDRA